MPSPLAHALCGGCIAAAAARWHPEARTPRVAAATILAANLPDVDHLFVLAGGAGSLHDVHQGFTHSFGFALLAALPLALLLRGRLAFPAAAALLALAGVTHPLLDFFGVDAWPPIGVPLFWPFAEGRFHSPVSLFPAIAKSSLEDVFSLQNVRVAAIETAWLLPPLWLLLRRGRRVAEPALPLVAEGDSRA